MTLRDSFAEFLHILHLPDDIIRNVPKWHNFLRQYLNIIEDCPLNLRSGNSASSLNAVVVNISEDRPPNVPDDSEIYSLTIKWTFIGRDEQIGRLNNHLMIPVEYIDKN